jgi:hypothetical protein
VKGIENITIVKQKRKKRKKERSKEATREYLDW